MALLKVLLLGERGMAGHVIYRFLQRSERYHLASLDEILFEGVRVKPENLSALADAIVRFRPDVVINAIGALIGDSNKEPANSIFVNSFLPHWLAELANANALRVIHISTDCVFSGKQGGYCESALRDADDIYGRSKALGELQGSPHLTLRTSIIGPELRHPGTGLFDWAFRQKELVRGYSRVFWSGVTTIDLARAIDFSISEGICGLKQLSHSQKINKFDLLRLIKDCFSLPFSLSDDPKPSYDKSLLPSLNFDFVPLEYEQMILEMRDWIFANQSLYPHYLI
jgi:dTDP-4-dehydrorhamnose reductase